MLDLLNDLLARDDLAKDNMQPVQMRGRLSRDEELTAIGILAAIGH